VEGGSTQCRICASRDIAEAGWVEYISGYAWMVYDCVGCGCRFTKHDKSVYEVLHQSGAISYYSEYDGIARQCQSLFCQNNREGLRDLLSRTSKYRFIIERLSNEPPDARVLEIGSSRGYLTSYFILESRRILGVDVSREAVKNARASFGEHFAVTDDVAIHAAGPYDIIYHVGTIGCVADPIGLTRKLLALLRPGGKLIFNAPNRMALHLQKQLWLDSAPPPDLVSIFPQGFWTRQFSDSASVSEEMELLPSDRALLIGLRRLFGRRWRKPIPKSLKCARGRGHSWSQQAGGVWHLFERSILKVGLLARFSALMPKRPSDFGLFVTMVRK
jgi:SAM-dependent methyltransferase